MNAFAAQLAIRGNILCGRETDESNFRVRQDHAFHPF
jgi:hypothetical protein